MALLRVLAYSCKDFQGIKDVEFIPDPHVVLIVGPNGSGKTAVLESMYAAIGGKNKSPEMPVRKGQTRAECTVDLGETVSEIRVTRKWAADGETRLYVENADGSKPKSPQALLDSLISAVSFNPMDFLRKRPEEQARMLRTMAGLDGPFAEIDAQIKGHSEERKQLNQAIRFDEGALATYPESEFEGVPDVAPSVSDLTSRHREILQEIQENAEIRRNVERAKSVRESAGAAWKAALDRVRDLESQLANAVTDAKYLEQDVRDAQDELAAAYEVVGDGLIDPDTSDVERQIAEAGNISTKVFRKQERAAIHTRWVENREHSASLTAQMDALEAKKKDLLLRSTLPVDGLDCTGDEVLFQGIPFCQVNRAQQIRLTMAIGAASSPTLRVARIEDGSLLDDDSLATIWDWAIENDYQIFIERVGPSDSKVGVIIEDGRLVADRQFKHGMEVNGGA